MCWIESELHRRNRRESRLRICTTKKGGKNAPEILLVIKWKVILVRYSSIALTLLLGAIKVFFLAFFNFTIFIFRLNTEICLCCVRLFIYFILFFSFNFTVCAVVFIFPRWISLCVYRIIKERKLERKKEEEKNTRTTTIFRVRDSRNVWIKKNNCILDSHTHAHTHTLGDTETHARIRTFECVYKVTI